MAWGRHKFAFTPVPITPVLMTCYSSTVCVSQFYSTFSDVGMTGPGANSAVRV